VGLSRSGRAGEVENFQSLPGLEAPVIQPVAKLFPAELSRLRFGLPAQLVLFTHP
jgi:hypothetical protein